MEFKILIKDVLFLMKLNKFAVHSVLKRINLRQNGEKPSDIRPKLIYE